MTCILSSIQEAAKLVQPSLRREGFSAIPKVTWEDVGGLKELRREFERHIVGRIKYRQLDEVIMRLLYHVNNVCFALILQN